MGSIVVGPVGQRLAVWWSSGIAGRIIIALGGVAVCVMIGTALSVTVHFADNTRRTATWVAPSNTALLQPTAAAEHERDEPTLTEPIISVPWPAPQAVRPSPSSSVSPSPGPTPDADATSSPIPFPMPDQEQTTTPPVVEPAPGVAPVVAPAPAPLPTPYQIISGLLQLP